MKKFVDYLPYVLGICVLIINLIIFYALMKVLNVWEKEIVAAIIGFIGSILGGFLTLVGVRLTLRHRDRELFLNTALEKLINIEAASNEMKPFINRLFFYEHSNMDDEGKYEMIRITAEEFLTTFSRNKDLLYKSITYDELSILKFLELSLRGKINHSSIAKKRLNEQTAKECSEKVREIMGVVLKSQELLERKYYQYKKEHENF